MTVRIDTLRNNLEESVHAAQNSAERVIKKKRVQHRRQTNITKSWILVEKNLNPNERLDFSVVQSKVEETRKKSHSNEQKNAVHQFFLLIRESRAPSAVRRSTRAESTVMDYYRRLPWPRVRGTRKEKVNRATRVLIAMHMQISASVLGNSAHETGNRAVSLWKTCWPAATSLYVVYVSIAASPDIYPAPLRADLSLFA